MVCSNNAEYGDDDELIKLVLTHSYSYEHAKDLLW